MAAAVLGLAAIAVAVRLFQLMVIVRAREPQEPLVMPEVERGAILDRKGRVLAITTRHQMASAWVPAITDPKATAELLGPVLAMDPDALLESWRKHPGYDIVKRRLSPDEASAVGRLKTEGKLTGIRLEDEYGRMYPEGTLASHLIGYVGIDNSGLDGIEFSFNNELAPQPVGTNRETVYGDQLYLTIDRAVQHRVERVAREAFRTNRADWLSVLVADARTAEILAWVTLPDFDPNDFQQPSPQVPSAAVNTRPETIAFEPGSVFKVFSIASLLELGTITPESTFFCNGLYEREIPGGSTIRIRCIRPHGTVDPRLILKYSCNVGAGYASDTAEEASFAATLARFGFGAVTGVPLPGETAGIFRPVSQWSQRSKPTIAIGQEVSVSVLQIVAGATAIANHGMLLRPSVVSRIVAPDGRVVKEFGRTERWQAVSAKTADTVLGMMESATEEGGTARRAAVDGLRISAKTGTAQVLDPRTGRYSDTDFVASLLAIFPTDNPRLIVYVVIQNPRGESYLGSTIAAPIFHDIALELVDSLGLVGAGAASVRHEGTLAVTLPTPVAIGERMPDLSGMPKRLLLPLLLRDDLQVTIKGSGFVVRQEPAPGTPVEKGARIVLELE